MKDHAAAGQGLGATGGPPALARSLWCLRPDQGKGAEVRHDELHATRIGIPSGIHASITHAGTPVARILAGSALTTCEPVVHASLLSLRELLQPAGPHACAPTPNQLSPHTSFSVQLTAAQNHTTILNPLLALGQGQTPIITEKVL